MQRVATSPGLLLVALGRGEVIYWTAAGGLLVRSQQPDAAPRLLMLEKPTASVSGGGRAYVVLGGEVLYRIDLP